MRSHFIEPDWPAATSVRAYSTLRTGGVSQGPFDSFNLADHVGDAPEAVAENRSRLSKTLDLSSEPSWLAQVHGTHVVRLPCDEHAPQADGAVSFGPGSVGAVLTADCLPVLFCDRAGTRVGVAHAGWRGLAAGILEATAESLAAPANELLVWLGPGIGRQAFEVGEEVRAAFLAGDSGADSAFRRSAGGAWLADLDSLARRRLTTLGVGSISGGGFCTYSDPERFFSYRRDPGCGRMATVIWLEP